MCFVLVKRPVQIYVIICFRVFSLLNIYIHVIIIIIRDLKLHLFICKLVVFVFLSQWLIQHWIYLGRKRKKEILLSVKPCLYSIYYQCLAPLYYTVMIFVILALPPITWILTVKLPHLDCGMFSNDEKLNLIIRSLSLFKLV